MSAELLPQSDDDAPTFGNVRECIQADTFTRLTERIDRLRWDAARLRKWQRDRLRALLAQVTQRSAFHARRLRGVDPARFELADLANLPVMTKAQMMADFDDVVTDKRMNRAAAERALAATSTEPVPLPGGHLCMATGGSSGQRGIFGYDPAAAAEFVTMIFRTRIAVMAAAAPADGQLTGDGLGRIVVPAHIPDSTIDYRHGGRAVRGAWHHVGAVPVGGQPYQFRPCAGHVADCRDGWPPERAAA